MVAALGQPPELAQGRPDRAVAGHPRGGITPLLGRAQQLPGGLVRHGQLATHEVMHRSPVQGWEELRDVAQLAAQVASPSVGAAGLRRREALAAIDAWPSASCRPSSRRLRSGPSGSPATPSSPLVSWATASAIAERTSPLAGTLPVVDRLLDGARALAAEGVPTETVITARHHGSSIVAMRSTVDDAGGGRLRNRTVADCGSDCGSRSEWPVPPGTECPKTRAAMWTWRIGHPLLLPAPWGHPAPTNRIAVNAGSRAGNRARRPVSHGAVRSTGT